MEKTDDDGLMGVEILSEQSTLLFLEFQKLLDTQSNSLVEIST